MEKFDDRLELEKAVRKRIETWLDDNGYRRGLHGFCDHKHGLPTIPNVMVRPTHSEDPGARTLMVTPVAVIEAKIPQPYPENIWTVVGVRTYSTLDQLKAILDESCYLDLGPWSEDAVVE